ncbi:winged helix-turn-helix transcriptional regulator [Sphingomonas sp. AX6]|uniref:winged helix-turn-helix transcriptional regulator n=1 Tax=Sphingomonas sp. AX6 TaxID=2653171 RepID=UPI00135BE327|nr:response regulator transcription factor [Sphingomonas sp. AX6]
MGKIVATNVNLAGLDAAASARGLSLVSFDAADWRGLAALFVDWRMQIGPARELVDTIRGRGWRGPIVLRAMGGSAMVALAIDAGADDAVDGRAGPEEIAARLAAAVRAPTNRIGVGDLVIDRIQRSAQRAGRPIDLLPREYALLVHLAERADQVVSRGALLDAVWGLRIDPGTNVVQVHVSRLRAKLDRGQPHPMLLSERGKGYRLAPG